MVEVARRAGDEAVHANDVGLGAATDEAVASHAKAHGLTLVTRDLDFSDVRAYPPADYPGLVVLRLSEHLVAEEICSVFALLLAQRDLVEHLAGRLAILEDGRVRVRPPLEQ